MTFMVGGIEATGAQNARFVSRASLTAIGSFPALEYVPTWLSSRGFGIFSTFYGALSISQAPRLVFWGEAAGEEERGVVATPSKGAEEELKKLPAGFVAVSVAVFMGKITKLSAELLFLQRHEHRGG